MALIWADFPSGQRGLYGTDETKMLNGVWAEIASAGLSYDCLVNDPDPSIGSSGVVLWAESLTISSGENSKKVRLALPSEVTTLGMGFRLWLAKLPSDTENYPFFSFRDNTNTEILSLRVSTTGQLIAVKAAGSHGGGGTVLATSSPILTANAWKHVEIKCTKGAGTGALEVRVDGSVVAGLTLSSQSFSANNIAQIVLGCREQASGDDAAMDAYWKDLILWDTSGAQVNDFQGAVAVHDLVPDGDQSLNWTPSTGATGWNLVDEGSSGPDDADYVSADATQTTPTSFTMTNLPPDVISVRAVMPIGRQVKTDGGTCTTLMGVSPNNTDWDDGTDRAITIASTYWWDVSHLSPATGAAWTPSEVDSMRFRIDRTS